MGSQIVAERLSKTYMVPEREPGLLAAMKHLAKPKFRAVEAVKSADFTIGQGELVGFLGQNGAGKTTVLKMLAGLLYPAAGQVRVAGYEPQKRENDFLRRIGMVMGGRSQLQWNNTVGDSFSIFAQIYSVPDAEYRRRLAELCDIFDIGKLLGKQTRSLSLGERAKCEFAAVLLHRPEVLFLDEPTIGMDVSMQLRLREFVRRINTQFGTTVLLTSHFMSDICSLTPRVILIREGRLEFDGALTALAERVAPWRLIRLAAEAPGALDAAMGEMRLDHTESESGELTLRVRREDVTRVMSRLLATGAVADFHVEEPPIEAVMDAVYAKGAAV